ncbi:hypothetical protein KAR28_00585 [Candidatus Parcubacteria bacterium]|nr:hypothetical protein [Candidatus Parcubacteria bacterium]
MENLKDYNKPENNKEYDKVFDEMVEIAVYLRTIEPNRFKNNNNIMADFGRKILQNFSSEVNKYYLWHALSGSNLELEDRGKPYAQLKNEGIMDEFDFPDEYSIEAFLRKMYKQEKEKNAE